MNERILKLANIWANRRSEDDKLGITYTFSETALEMFAELIVRECAEVIDNTISPPSHVMNSIGYKLKHHFGIVEE